MTPLTLTTYGWRSWDQARELLAGCDGLWLGTANVVHSVKAWPTAMPLTTRLHAWDEVRMWRLIPDHGRAQVLVTALTESPGTGPEPWREVMAAVSDTDDLIRYVITESSSITSLRPSASGRSGES